MNIDRDYWGKLRWYRDLALNHPDLMGEQTIGFLVDTADAWWMTEDYGTAHLKDERLRLKSNRVKKFPTTLKLMNNHGDLGINVVTFRMDLDVTNTIEVSHSNLAKSSIWQAVLARKPQMPTDKEYELAYSELNRGASGMYPLIHMREDSDFEE